MILRKTKARLRKLAPDKDDAVSEATARDRAQARRAQVRRAQIQHRQRKANYVRQLEMDISGIRDSIATAEKDRLALMSENQAIREYLQAMNSLNNQTELLISSQPPTTVGTPLLDDFDLGEFNLSLGTDEIMQSPAYQISGPVLSDDAGEGSSSHPIPPVHDVGLPGLPDMTPDQTQQAINFILA